MADRCMLLICIIVASPGALTLMHVACARIAPHMHRQLVAAFAIAVTGVALLAAAGLGGFDAVSIAYLMIAFGGVGYSYFHVFNLSETARRIRIMTELADGPLAERDLLQRYKPDDAVSQRVERLVTMGWLVVVDGRYRLQGNFQVVLARSVLAWRAVLGLRDRQSGTKSETAGSTRSSATQSPP